MPPKRLVEVPLFPPDAAPRSHCRKRPSSDPESVSRTTVDCFPSTSSVVTSVTPPISEPPARVPFNPLVRKRTQLTKTVCTVDVTPPKKRVTFELSDHCTPGPLVPSTS